MSVKEIEPRVQSQAYRLNEKPRTQDESATFEAFLSAASSTPTGDSHVSAATAAEILRLQMLNSAVSVADDNLPVTSSPNNLSLKQILTAFQQHEQQSAVESPSVQRPDQVVPAKPEAATPLENTPIDAIIGKASIRYGVDEALIKAVIKAESNFNPRAISHAGAQGLMQLMPATARGLGVTDAFDMEQNVMAGTRFLKDMLNRYGGDVDAALAAYNWGPGNVDRKGTSSLPRETREYLVKVKGYFSQYLG